MTGSFWSLSLLLDWSHSLALSTGSVSSSSLSTGLTLGWCLVTTILWLDLLLLSVLLVLVDRPVEDIVILETFTNEEITEDLSEVRVIWLVVEAEGASVVEVDGKLIGESTAEDFGRGRHLLLHDPVILLLLGSSLETLPWKRTTTEVEHDISQGFHVITTGLL